ncbi:6-phosphofructokinase, partial [Peptoanaerobacter stomatis]
LLSANRGKTQSIIMVAEGVGSANDICVQIHEKTGLDVRATILGHIQRGGSPTAKDRILASQFAAHAVQCLLDGKSSRVVGIRENKIIDMDITEALSIKSKFNEEMYELTKILSI